jgi:transposase
MDEQYKSETIEHLGLVANMVEELGIVERIDQAIPQDFSQRKVSVGQAIKALIVCGLGFTNHRLYLAGQFFANKPTERLIGTGIEAKHINDDLLGRSLDALYEYGVTALFHQISRGAAAKLGVESNGYHADSTSFHVDGQYNSETEDVDPGLIHITKGYSRDHRPDLNQFSLNLIVEHQAGLPMSLQLGSGNQSDCQALPALIKQYISQLEPYNDRPLFVADAAWYTQENLKATQEEDGYLFVSRVPAKLKLVKEIEATLDLDSLMPLKPGYRGQCVCRSYGGVEQRWLVVHSEAAKQRVQKTMSRRVAKLSEAEMKQWQQLCRQTFNCELDAEQAVKQFLKACDYCELVEWEMVPQPHYAQAGRPKKDAIPAFYTYSIKGALCISLASYDQLLDRAALFVLATNQLDEVHFTPVDILNTYQGQVKVERGFRFLKDPLFMANTIFLKKEERVMAVMMVMTLCLLVYAALEHRIRHLLQTNTLTIPDQKGRPTATPTARWVFQSFLDVSLLSIFLPDSNPRILCLNLRLELHVLLKLLGPSYASIYSLPDS